MIKGLSEFTFPPVYRVQMKSGVGNIGELVVTIISPIFENHVLIKHTYL